MSWGKSWSLIGMVMVMSAVVVITGCIGTEKDDGDENRELSLAGSTTVLPIAQACADAYMDDNGDVDITVAGGGSSAGVEAVAKGTAGIGMASRTLKDSEKADYPSLVTHKIANDGIAVIVHSDNGVTDLSMEDVVKIYTGQATNWKDVGGSDAEIVVVGRDSASGTRASFEEITGIEDEGGPTDTMLEQQSNNGVYETVKGNEQAIGYVGLGYVGSGVKSVSIGGVSCSVSTVKAGDYPIGRALWMITDGDADGLAKKYIDFVKSAEGQAIVEEKGFIAI